MRLLFHIWFVLKVFVNRAIFGTVLRLGFPVHIFGFDSDEWRRENKFCCRISKGFVKETD